AERFEDVELIEQRLQLLQLRVVDDECFQRLQVAAAVAPGGRHASIPHVSDKSLMKSGFRCRTTGAYCGIRSRRTEKGRDRQIWLSGGNSREKVGRFTSSSTLVRRSSGATK